MGEHVFKSVLLRRCINATQHVRLRCFKSMCMLYCSQLRRMSSIQRPKCLQNATTCCVQPIKIRLKDQCQTAIMCQIRTDHDTDLIRLSAIDKRNPLFSLMFAKDGSLLTANSAALRKYGAHCVGGT